MGCLQLSRQHPELQNRTLDEKFKLTSSFNLTVPMGIDGGIW